MPSQNSKFLILLLLLFLVNLSCRPVLTIGWQEIGILFVLLLILLGPMLFRFFKRFNEYKDWKNRKDENSG